MGQRRKERDNDKEKKQRGKEEVSMGYVHGSVEGSDWTALFLLHVPSCSLQGMKGGSQPIGI